jgi:hypothetical protein
VILSPVVFPGSNNIIEQFEEIAQMGIDIVGPYYVTSTISTLLLMLTKLVTTSSSHC